VSATSTRIRLLVAASTAEDPSWAAWLAARDASTQASRIVLQRVSRKGDPGSQATVGLGFAESLRWFGPVDGDAGRRLVIEYAEQALAAGSFPPVGTELQRMAWVVGAAGGGGRTGADGPGGAAGIGDVACTGGAAGVGVLPALAVLRALGAPRALGVLPALVALLAPTGVAGTGAPTGTAGASRQRSLRATESFCFRTPTRICWHCDVRWTNCRQDFRPLWVTR